jgi:1-acyl-sn-glycerol-3-phosphate acyltransferase
MSTVSQKTEPHISILFIRSLIFAIIMPTFATFYSLICVAAFPLPLRYRFEVVMGWTRSIVWLLKVICHIDYRIDGMENIPKNRNGIILSKHQSTWETFFLPGLFRQTAIILKRELLWIPFFGWGLAVTSPIGINRNNTLSAMSQIINQGKKCLDAGRWILIFPEGTRVASGKVGKYRLGGPRLATATGYPILPIAHNAGRFWPRRRFIKHPGTIHVVIGPLIETTGRTPEEVLTQTKQWIEDTMLQIDR